jgi:hypothetical protein
MSYPKSCNYGYNTRIYWNIFYRQKENNLSNGLNKILFTTSKPGNLLKSFMEFNNLKLIIIL